MDFAQNYINRLNDRQLVARMRQHDRTAFDTLYHRYGERIFAFAFHLTGNRGDAEDLVQETFLALFSAAAEFRGESQLLTYLIGIALRRYRDAARRPLPVTVPLFDESDASGDHSAGASPIEEQVVASVLCHHAILQLDEPLREAFLLVAGQGLTHREAAVVLEIPVGTIKWRVAEATRRMRRLLSEEKEESKSSETNRSQNSSIAGREKEKDIQNEASDLPRILR